MSDDEFTQHELHPSSPSRYSELSYEASQIVEPWPLTPSPAPLFLRSSSPLLPPPSQSPIPQHSCSPTLVSTSLPVTQVSKPSSTLLKHRRSRSPTLSCSPTPSCRTPARPAPSSVSPGYVTSQVSFEDVRPDRPARRAAIASGRRISNLYVAGGMLDSQTTDSQFVDHEAYRQPEDTATVCAGGTEAHEEDTRIDGHGDELARVRVELARTQVELARTRRELYEYVGRWILAGTHVKRLADEVTALQVSTRDVSHATPTPKAVGTTGVQGDGRRTRQRSSSEQEQEQDGRMGAKRTRME